MKKFFKKSTILFLLGILLAAVNPIDSSINDFTIHLLQEMPNPDMPDNNM